MSNSKSINEISKDNTQRIIDKEGRISGTTRINYHNGNKSNTCKRMLKKVVYQTNHQNNNNNTNK